MPCSLQISFTVLPDSYDCRIVTICGFEKRVFFHTVFYRKLENNLYVTVVFFRGVLQFQAIEVLSHL
jgi:hypothetical protein